tara:strand:- start:681 stop:1124 length:444 start_codon:yes stop_codon:yes gene_type:complete
MIKIKIIEASTCDPCSSGAPLPEKPMSYKNTHNNEEARMHRTTLAHLMADVKVLLDLIRDEDDLPEWLETKITKAGDYMSSAARYIAGNKARDMGQLEEEVTQTFQRDEAQTRIINILDNLKARVGTMPDQELSRVMNVLSQTGAAP